MKFLPTENTKDLVFIQFHEFYQFLCPQTLDEFGYILQEHIFTTVSRLARKRQALGKHQESSHYLLKSSTVV